MMRSHISFVAIALPPPVHGQSIVNKAVVDRLVSLCRDQVVVCNISPRVSKKGIIYHARRVVSVFEAASRFVFCRLSCREMTSYFVLESGLGVVYNAALIGLARLFGSKIFIHHHTAFHTLSSSCKFKFIAALSGRSAVHVVLCEGMEKDLLRRYSETKKSKVVNNAFFVEEQGEGVFLPLGKKITLGYISNLCVEKGSLLVFKTFRYCVGRGLNVHLVVAGPVSDQETNVALMELKEDYPDRVEYCGAVYGQTKNEFYSKINISLFPSQYIFEAQPLVVLEALQRGVPVLATPKGYVEDLLNDLGLVMPDEESEYVEAVFKKISEWVLDGSLFIDVSRSARRRFMDLRKESEEQFNDLIADLADGKNCALAQ